MRERQIAVITVADDLHALAVRHAFARHPDVTVHIIESNRLSGADGLSWTGEPGDDAWLATRDGGRVLVRDLDLIWWRRAGSPQTLPDAITNPDYIDVVNNDCQAALLGLALTEFKGSWINHPTATRTAENKLVQLRAARSAGLRVPRTLVSQDPERIRRFCAELDGQVVIKPVKGSRNVPLLACKVTPEVLADDAALRLSPAIYQELIPGTRHLRIHVFGATVYPVLIESEDLDWRDNLEIPFSVAALPPGLADSLHAVRRVLNLRMGIFDLKLTATGEPVWLEVNPQGQFLFCEGLAEVDLTTPFVDFLYEELPA